MLNRATLIGRLGTDPELKYTPAGNAVCNFSLATTKVWNDKKGQRQEKTEWHRIVVWSKLAETCNQYLRKGRQVFLEGEIQTRKWTDKNQIDRYATEIEVHTVKFLGDSPNKESNQNAQKSDSNKSPQKQDAGFMPHDQSQNNFSVDDIPF